MTQKPPATGKPVRVQKYLSQAGLVSRREAERLVDLGRVKVNDRVVDQQGTKIVPGVDRVFLDGTEVLPAEHKWVVFHKPTGVLSTRGDPHGGKTVYDVLPDWASGLRYVGRLDRETSGLLVMTNDGDAAARLTHPSGRIEREYVATVRGSVTARIIRSLKQGVELEDGPAKPKRVRRIEGGPGTSTLSIVLTEGRKREVRRMMSTAGHPVITLSRVGFGPFRLGTLAAGTWRAALPTELAAVDRFMRPPGARGRGRPSRSRPRGR